MTMSITSSTFGKRTYKIILLGDTNTGKTSIIERFVNDNFDGKQNNPTIGIDFLGKNLQYKGTTCRLQLWDTAGQQRYKSLIPTYLKDAICAIFVFDVSKNQSLQNLENWIEMFRDHKGQKTVSIICGNKSDLGNDFNQKDLNRLCQKYKFPCEYVSAKNGDNIMNMFHKILDLINQMHGAAKKRIRNNQLEQYQEAPLTKDPIADKNEQVQGQQTKKIKLQGQKTEVSKKSRCC